MSDIIGFHIVCTTYGFWLPNDQRGSGSDYVRRAELRPFGAATKVEHSRSVAKLPFDPKVRAMARSALMYPYVTFTDDQIASVIRGVSEEIIRFNPADVFAYAQLRDHFHFVCGNCRYDIRRFAGRLKGAGTKQLLKDGLHPLARFRTPGGEAPSPWSQKPWVVYLFDDEDVIRSTRYVHHNLARAGMKPQHHSFVDPYL